MPNGALVQEGNTDTVGMVDEGWRRAVVYTSPSSWNANAIEKALHERYKHCLGPGGLKIALAQRDGAGGTGGTLCDEYYVRMLDERRPTARSDWRCCLQVFITYNVDFKSGELLGETREDCRE